MRQVFIKIGILAVVFIAALFVTSYFTNHENEDLTSEMEGATLPVVYMMKDGKKINELHGYTTAMEGRYMRGNIMPVFDDRTIDLQIQTYGFSVDLLSYEVRSLDMERLIENTEISDYSSSGSRITVQLKLENLLEQDEEYMLTLKAEGGGKTVYYYVRVIMGGSSYIEDCLSFVYEFHNATLNPEALGTLSTYLEPNAAGDNTTLHHVTIHSNLSQIGWGDFDGKELSSPIAFINEITDSYNVISLKYVMASTGTNGELEYYNVVENFRLRYTSERIYLLDYDRTMNQIFRGENDSFYDNYVQLGIRDTDVAYMANENGSSVFFVQEGELWAYHIAEGQETQVFSFRGFEGIDERENYMDYEIKLIQVDESGSADFIVVGYMNRGSHEGQVGLSVYHYDSAVNTVEEEVFISFNQSYQILKEEIGQLLYTSKDSKFYFMLEGCIYQIDLQTMELSVRVKGLDDGTYAVSESGRYVALAKKNANGEYEAIQVLDLENQDVSEITAQDGQQILPLCYMQEDLVYGRAYSADVTTDQLGNLVFPGYHVTILGEDGNPEKEFEKSGLYVLDASVKGATIYLDLASNNNGIYIKTTQETIVNNENIREETVLLHTTVTQERQTQVQLELAEEISGKSPKLLTPKQVLFENERETEFSLEYSQETYFAYAWGKVVCSAKKLAEVIHGANEEKGVVVDTNQEYIWKRAKAASVSPLVTSLANTEGNTSALARCIALLLETKDVHISVDPLLEDQKTAAEILDNALWGEMLDLSGCTLDEVLYYVSEGTPVLALDSTAGAVLVIGYDSTNIMIYEPGSNAVKTVKIQEWQEDFEKWGNVFITCR